jgi:hypothetical protein
MPKAEAPPVEDVHAQQTVILTDRGRGARGSQRRSKSGKVQVPVDEDLHAAETMIIDIGRARRRR